jgi:hypothetical protein
MTPRDLPAPLARSLVSAAQRDHSANARARTARFQLAQALADAQAKGYSVRTLAQALDVQPTTVQRLIAGTKR